MKDKTDEKTQIQVEDKNNDMKSKQGFHINEQTSKYRKSCLGLECDICSRPLTELSS